jgi:hypothetical protein
MWLIKYHTLYHKFYWNGGDKNIRKDKGDIMYQQKIIFQKINNPINKYDGYILEEDYESCVISFLLEGTEATIVCFYDEWVVEKIYE